MCLLKKISALSNRDILISSLPSVWREKKREKMNMNRRRRSINKAGKRKRRKTADGDEEIKTLYD